MAPGGGRSGVVGAGRGVHRRSPHVRAEKGRTGTAPGTELGGFPPAPRYRRLGSAAFQSTGYSAPQELRREERQDYKSQCAPRRCASGEGPAGPRGLPRFVVLRVGVGRVRHGSCAEVKISPGRPDRQRDGEIGALRGVLRVPGRAGGAAQLFAAASSGGVGLCGREGAEESFSLLFLQLFHHEDSVPAPRSAEPLAGAAGAWR